LRLASPPRRAHRSRPGGGRGARRNHLGDRRAARAPPAHPARWGVVRDRLTLCGATRPARLRRNPPPRPLNGCPTNEKEDRMALRKWIMTGALALIAAPVLAGDAGSFRQQFAAERAALFAQADADGDGALSPAEFQTFMQLVKQKMMEHR